MTYTKHCAAAASLIKQSDTAIDRVLENGAVKLLLPETDGKYDVGAALNALKAGINESGSLPITVSPVPLLLKKEQVLTFHKDDVEMLRQRIQEVSNG